MKIIINVILMCMALNVYAQVPQTMSYQGVLTDTEGNIVPDREYTLTFRLYSSPDNSALLWEENQQNISVQSGLFNVILGSITPLDLPFDQPYYFAISINDGGELSPRIELTAAAYSLNARSVADSAVTGKKIADRQVVRAIKILAPDGSRIATLTDSVNLRAGNNISFDVDGFTGEVFMSAAGGSGGSGGWSLSGNAGSDVNSNFLGTTDDQALELRVNNQRVLRLEPTDEAPNIIAGDSNNIVDPDVVGATISGGGALDDGGGEAPNQVTDNYGTIGGGFRNSAGLQAVVGGGTFNMASGTQSTVAGGTANQSIATNATVGGGGLNKASAFNAVVSGGQVNTASGIYSAVAGGQQNIASGSHSAIAGGKSNSASASYSFIGGGLGNIVEGERATITGGNANTATQFGAMVGGGSGNNSTSNFATVGGGQSNTASGFAATVPGGTANVALGDYGLAGGRFARANHKGAFVWNDAAGITAVDSFSSTAENQFLINAVGGVGIGTNQPNSPLTVAGIIESSLGGFKFPDGTLQISAAADNSNPWQTSASDIFYNNGNVGIGTTTPIEKLHLNTPSDTDMKIFFSEDGTPATSLFYEGSAGVSTNNLIHLRSEISGKEANVMTWKLNGNVGIGVSNPTEKLHINGNALADAHTTPSSRRWKANVETIEDALEKVQALRGVTYDWKESGKHDIGLIAEEVGEVIPEIVAFEENGVDAKSVDYARLVAVLIEAVKEQQKTIDELKKENDALAETRSALSKLNAKVDRLAGQLSQTAILNSN